MLLQALAACAGVTMLSVATSLGVDVAAAPARQKATWTSADPGVGKDAPVGFRSIRLVFDLETEARPSWPRCIRLTERYCVVYQTLSRPAEMAISVTQTAGPDAGAVAADHTRGLFCIRRSMLFV